MLHPGAHLGAGERDGIAWSRASLDAVHERTRGLRVRLLIEVTAGQGSCLGCRFEQVEAMLSSARGGGEVGICFDTCHVHASGYDLSTDEGYDRTFDELDRVLGIDRIEAFHLNDSKSPAGSRVDRHAEIGDGFLGQAAVLAPGQRPALRAASPACSRRRPARTSCRRSSETSSGCGRWSERRDRRSRRRKQEVPDEGKKKKDSRQQSLF